MRSSLVLPVLALALCAASPMARGPSDGVGVGLLARAQRDKALAPEVNVLWAMPSTPGLNRAVECIVSSLIIKDRPSPTFSPDDVSLNLEQTCQGCPEAATDFSLAEDVRVIVGRHRASCDAYLHRLRLDVLERAVKRVKTATDAAAREPALWTARSLQAELKDDPDAQPLLAELDALERRPAAKPANEPSRVPSPLDSVVQALRGQQQANDQMMKVLTQTLERCARPADCTDAKKRLEEAKRLDAVLDAQIADAEARKSR